jgi:hypothetical protein
MTPSGGFRGSALVSVVTGGQWREAHAEISSNSSMIREW